MSSTLLAQSIDREAVGRALAEVYSRPDLRPPGEGWLEQQFRRLFEWLPGLELPEGTGWALIWLLGIVGGVALAWLVAQLTRNTRWPRPSTTAAGAATLVAPVSSADRLGELRRLAREARERGDLAGALRLGFFALLVGLGRLGRLEYRDAWTARELVERGHPGPEVSASLEGLVSWVDERTFGRHPVTEADLDVLDAVCERWLAGKEGAP